MLPVVFLQDTEEVTMLYWKETTLMLIGSIMIAIAIEYSNLHRRIAMYAMLIIGCSQRRITFALMLVTTFISMWISNAATCAMMLPIGTAVLEELESVCIAICLFLLTLLIDMFFFAERSVQNISSIETRCGCR